MIIVLLTLFVIALAITFAGLFLSPKAQAPNERSTIAPSRARGYHSSGKIYRGTTTTQTNRSTAYRTYRTTTTQVYRADGRSYPTRSVRLRRPIVEEKRRSMARASWVYLEPFFNLRRLFENRMGAQTPWGGIVLILVALFGIGIISIRPFFPDAEILQTSWINSALAAPAPTSVPTTPVLQMDLFKGVIGASSALVRLGQMDHNQYSSGDEYNTWAVSACSATSMTEVINAYGYHYRIADILKVESGIKMIDPELGLLYPIGIDRTVDKFGFQTMHLNNPTLDEIIEIGNKGRPVIVSFPPQRWSGGHILVLRGGNRDNVYLADSSEYNLTVVSRAKFLKYWGGFAVVVTPKQ